MFQYATASRANPKAAGDSRAKQSRGTGSLLTKAVDVRVLRIAGCRSGRLFESCRIGGCIVAGSSADDRFAGRVNHDTDLPVASVQRLNTRRIGNRVLIAYVVRHLDRE